MDFSNSNKMINKKTVLVVTIIAVTLVSWVGIIDSQSEKYVNSATGQALVAYASARGLNAVISMAKSIAVEIPYFGGLGAQPLETLDPLDDLVEQYSYIMKLSIVSLLTQKIIIEITSTTFFKIVLTLFSICVVCSIFIADGKYSPVFLKSFVFIGLIRFLIVLVIILNGMVDSAFLKDQTEKDIQTMKSSSDEMERQQSEENSSVQQKRHYTERVERLSQLSARLSESLKSAQRLEQESRIALVNSEMVLESTRSKIGTIDRINIFNGNEEIKYAKEQCKNAKKQHKHYLESVEDIEKELKSVSAEKQELTDILSGRVDSKSWLTSTRDKISSMTDMARFKKIKNIIENKVETMLNLMVSFLFKTLIMPLVFLFVLLKGFKRIWNIDPRTLAYRAKEELRASV